MASTRSRHPASIAAQVLACLWLLGLWSCTEEVATPALPESAPAFVTPASSAGAELCIDCHEDIVTSYAESAMARALGPVTPAELEGLAGLDGVPSPAGFIYGIFPTPNGEAFVLGETRPPNHAMGAELLFGIGAGVRDRSLAVQHGSSMYFAPLEVLTTPEGRELALAPGEMIAPGQRLTVPITPECLACHTDAPPPLDYPLHLRPAELAVRGISCGGCHGAAPSLEAHVAFQEADLAGEAPDGSDPLLRLADLERAERLSVCAACHLQGDARIELGNQRLGHFEVGTDITDTRAVFVGNVASNEVGFVSQTERLALSSCFLESALDCTTCHDPHRALSTENGERARVRATCSDCHTKEFVGPASGARLAATCSRAEGTQPPARFPSHLTRAPQHESRAVDCVTCHMPQTGVFDVAGITIHDHWIRRTPQPQGPRAADTLRFPEAPDGDWRRFVWPGEPEPPTLDDLGLWMMAFQSGGHSGRAADLIDAAPGDGASPLAMYHHLRGVLLEQVARQEDAVIEYETALSIDPQLGISGTNLGLLLGNLGRPREGLAVLDQLLERFPRADGALRNRALLRHQLGDPAGFRADLEAAFQLAPTSEVARLLASAFAEPAPTQDLDKARRYEQLAKELDPR